MANHIDVQLALEQYSASDVPSQADCESWINKVLASEHKDECELTVRFVENAESQTLNATYRGKDKPTNVLSFPFENPPGLHLPLLGDLVVCVPVIHQEAKQQEKRVEHHFAHMLVHGCLHLLGHDHQDDEEAEKMEVLEKTLLAELGIDDPYQDD